MESNILSDKKKDLLTKYLARIERDLNNLLDLKIDELTSKKNILTAKLIAKNFLDNKINS